MVNYKGKPVVSHVAKGEQENPPGRHAVPLVRAGSARPRRPKWSARQSGVLGRMPESGRTSREPGSDETR